MLQVVLQGPKELDFKQVPVPEPGEGQALIDVKRIGVCGSDIHVYHGKHKYATFPLVQGHEGSGVIVKTGPGVTGLKPGDLVTVRPQMFCGHCLLCRQGRYNLCKEYKVIGVLGSTIGMASEYFLIEADKLHKLPQTMSFDEGAMIEPAAVGIHSVKLGGNVKDWKVLVIGAGPIGNLTAQAAKALGADKVMITDINPARLDLASRCGIDFCVDTRNIGLEAALNQHFGPDGADLILDCAAIPKILEELVLIARRGSDIILVGNYYGAVPVELGLVQRRELRLVGTMNYTAIDYEDTIRFIENGEIKVKELVTNYFPIKEYAAAYQYIDDNADKVMKVLIRVND